MWGKLNKLKTALMEHLHQPLYSFNYKKVIMHESVKVKFTWVIMKKWKNGSSSPKMCPRAKLTNTDPLKFGSAVFHVSMEMENWH